MIDIGVEFALHAAGQRHDGHVEGALGQQVLDHRTHRLAAGDCDDVSVAQCLQQHVGRRTPDLLQRRVGTAGDRRRHDTG